MKETSCSFEFSIHKITGRNIYPLPPFPSPIVSFPRWCKLEKLASSRASISISISRVVDTLSAWERKNRDLTHGGSFVVPFSDSVYDLGNKKKTWASVSTHTHTSPSLPSPRDSLGIQWCNVAWTEKERERKKEGRKRDRNESLYYTFFVCFELDDSETILKIRSRIKDNKNSV